MRGTTSLKFIDAKQAKDIYRYKSIKIKLYRINTAIWYNKTCRRRQLTPAYVNIHINGKKQQCQKTLGTANQYRINQEIKFLYTKRIKLNEQLLKLHLKCAESWQRIWPITIQSIDYKLTREMENHYNNLNRKLAVVLQRINICILLHQLDFIPIQRSFFPKASPSTRSSAFST